jgi:hypothetical protein
MDLNDLARQRHQGAPICKAIFSVLFRLLLCSTWFVLAWYIGKQDYSSNPADEAKQRVACNFLYINGGFYTYIFAARFSKQYVRSVSCLLVNPCSVCLVSFSFLAFQVYLVIIWTRRFVNLTQEQKDLPCQSILLSVTSWIVSIYVVIWYVIFGLVGLGLIGLASYGLYKCCVKWREHRRNAW